MIVHGWPGNVYEFYKIIQQLPHSNYLADYRERSFVLGKRVSFTKQQIKQSGFATEIGPTGELIVSLDDGTFVELSSGEISLESII